MKKFTILIFLAFPVILSMNSVVLSQVTDIRGVVADSATGERIPYANVILKETGRGAATNTSGFYLIPSVPHGTYELVVSAVGYQRQIRRVVVSGTAAVVVNFRLAPQAIELEEVVVTGRAKAEQLDIQTSVHTLGKAELKRVPVAAQGDLLRSIAILPGIVSTSDVNAQFYVRGGSSDQNLIMVDGMRLYNPFHAFGLFSTVNPDLLSTAEVYTGAFPAEYGGRLSSVINLSTRDGNSASFNGRTNINFLSSNLHLEGPITQNIQALVSGRKSLFSSTFTKFLKQAVPLSFYDVFFKASVKNPESQDKYNVQGLITGDDLLASEPGDPTYAWRSQSFSAEANLPGGDRLYWHIFATFGQFKQERKSTNSAIAPVNNTVNEASLWANVTYYTDTKDLYFFGFEFDFPSTEYNFVNRLGEPGRLTSSIPQVGSWVHFQTRGSWLRADVGMRVEIASMLRGADIKATLQPRASVSADLYADWKAKASYGRFSQEVITITNEDDILPVFVPWIGLPNYLQPERSDHYVVGIEGNLLPALSINLQSFYKNYGSLVAYNRDKIEAGEPDYINAKGEAYGGEALVRYSHPIIDLYAAYTLTKVKVDLNGFIYAPRYDRRHTINLLGTLHPFKNFDISVRWEFGSGLPYTQTLGFYDKLRLGNGWPDRFYLETGVPQVLYGPKNAARLPAYHRMDASVAYQFTMFESIRWSVGVNVVNVYDRKNVFYFERTTGQRVNMLGFFPTANITLEFLP
jgi:hypothetical protein